MSTNSYLTATATADPRNAGRTPAELRTVVQVVENTGETWKEVTQVRSVSRNGAGFALQRACKVGRLVKMVMPLEPELRAYDEKEELYPVMGIVQYCNPVTVDGETIYHVGVGFIGKKVPDSYKSDPTQSYLICGMDKSGLWRVVEAEAQFKKRRDPRYWVGIGMTLSLIRQADRSVIKEETFTRNVSAGGLSFASKLEAEVGDKVKIACPDLDFYAIGQVRNVNRKKPNDPTLHVELDETKFPVDVLIAAKTVTPDGHA